MRYFLVGEDQPRLGEGCSYLDLWGCRSLQTEQTMVVGYCYPNFGVDEGIHQTLQSWVLKSGYRRP